MGFFDSLKRNTEVIKAETDVPNIALVESHRFAKILIMIFLSKEKPYRTRSIGSIRLIKS